MRGVPHTLGLQVSLERDTGLVPPAPAEMTGWSGDGSPGTGSLREFAIGAVTQHFTKSLNRVEGRDFKLPKSSQLDAMEAFQLSLGRDADFNLAKITFTDANVNTGKSLFINGGGNPDSAEPAISVIPTQAPSPPACQNQNRNFNTNVEDRDASCARATRRTFRRMAASGETINGGRHLRQPHVQHGIRGGSGRHRAVLSQQRREHARRRRGVLHRRPEFNDRTSARCTDSPSTTTQIDQIADFLRGVNTLQNIDVAGRELEELLANRNNPRREQDKRLQTAFEETQDAIDVLTGEDIFPTALTHLNSARQSHRASAAQHRFGSAPSARSAGDRQTG